MDESNVFKHVNLSSEVANHLREAIFLDKYKGGDRILEAKIAEELKISRAPVREAIKELENQGLVKTIPRKGSFVIELTQKDIEEIFEIRVLLESRILKIIIEGEMLTVKDFIMLRKIVDQMVESAESNKDVDNKIIDVNKKDIAFHKYLWEISGSKWTVKILSTLHHQLQLAMIIDSRLEESLAESAEKHYEIIKYLEKNDFEKTRNAVISHIVNYRKGLQNIGG